MKVLRSAVAVHGVSIRRDEASRRGWLGLILLILVLIPWPARADESWTDARQFGLENVPLLIDMLPGRSEMAGTSRGPDALPARGGEGRGGSSRA